MTAVNALLEMRREPLTLGPIKTELSAVAGEQVSQTIVLPKEPRHDQYVQTEDYLIHSETMPNPIEAPLAVILDESKGRSAARKIRILQHWEGVVVDIDGDTVVAELDSLIEPSRESEIVDFPLQQIADSDRALLLPGSIFYWQIGYETRPGGQIAMVSEIRMKRVQSWSKSMLRRVFSHADQAYQRFVDNVQADTARQ